MGGRIKMSLTEMVRLRDKSDQERNDEFNLRYVEFKDES